METRRALKKRLRLERIAAEQQARHDIIQSRVESIWYADGYYGDIARAHGVQFSSVTRIKRGVSFARITRLLGAKGKRPHGRYARHPRTKLTETEVVYIWKAVGDAAELAATMHISPASVLAIKARRVWSYVTADLGEPGKVFTKTRALESGEIRSIYLDPRKSSLIAQEYGITQVIVSHIKRRRYYKNVTADLVKQSPA